MHVDAPILVTNVHEQAGTSLYTRTLVVLEEGAEAEIWDQTVSADAESEGLVNGVVELIVGQNARLRYVSAQELNEQTWIFGAQRAIVARDGHVDWVTLGFGSKNGKVFLETKLDGPGAHASVTGAYASRGRQHLDVDTLQEHAAENTTSDLAFRGILNGRSSTVWRGMIQVDEGAQQTDAFQESRNLLVSKKAHADAIPGLEILADDVRCTHAAAIAQIDPEQLFYLRSRGLAGVAGQAPRHRGLPRGHRRASPGRADPPAGRRRDRGSSRRRARRVDVAPRARGRLTAGLRTRPASTSPSSETRGSGVTSRSSPPAAIDG